MDLSNLSVILADAAAPAPTGSPAPNPTAQLLQSVLIFAMFGAVFYFVLLRPQQKRAKEQAEMLKSVRPGDKIVTGGGIIGVVITVKEKSISIRSADSKMEISKAAITEITERSGETGESQAKS